ncbi:THUMP domain-containing class I SAM-dependent RNA methyltransferase [Pseudooctadecabacter jejudonensis]|uniref:Ribosomal RNA large subunit methyltransferase L n=1 Tax=Pseudooctadecabacter jejudonensis TaxID=1391910 RepID=A0A1Y5SAJ4_9RHOB|nr:RNA methyltransferase [Pseudooctadecabacter jejudonensis]SLN35980.1 Ribosomal RNA large subunit methyltransferase L [Pseudooctadecabacter jejudonensis]
MDIFLITAPGQQDVLASEAREKGFKVTETMPGGVTVQGDWPAVWRANLQLRGATRVLARIANFRALYLSQLEKNVREFDWPGLLPREGFISVEATCHKSKIYHAGAAAERVKTALAAHGYTPVDPGTETSFALKVRIDRDIVTLSLDTSGDSLHKRGHKEAVNKAPMRETMAAMFLRAAGYNGKTPFFDPMCGSGTFVIEAAEIARRLDPGRSRAFAFQQLPNFDADIFTAMHSPDRPSAHTAHGSDRDTGAIQMSQANADRAGVAEVTDFKPNPISAITPPSDTPGLILTNPPYGARIGNKAPLFALYTAFGDRMRSHFQGWRVGLTTTDAGLAKATKLPFKDAGAPVSHGGLKVRLYLTEPL